MILSHLRNSKLLCLTLLFFVFQNNLSFSQQTKTVVGKKIKEVKFFYEGFDDKPPTKVNELFKLGFITTLADGTVLTSGKYPENYPVTEYLVEITGAKAFGGPRMAHLATSKSQYSVQNCDDLVEGFIIIKAKRAEDKDWIYNEKILYSCGGINKSEQQKKDEIAAEKKRLEQIAAREKLNKEGVIIASTVVGNQVGVVVPDSKTTFKKVMEFDKTKSKTEMAFSSLENTNTVEIDGKVFLLGKVVQLVENKPVFLPAIYEVGSTGTKALELNFNSFDAENITFRDVEKLSSTEILVAGDFNLQKMKKTQKGYEITKHILFKGENSLYFTDIVALDNNKSASVGYTQLNSTKPGPSTELDEMIYLRGDQYKKFRDEKIDYETYKKNRPTFKCTAYLVIWDHVTGKSVKLPLGDDVSELSVLRKGKDGELIFSLGKSPIRNYIFSQRKYPSDRIQRSSIQSINVNETFSQNKLVSNWETRIDFGENFSDKMVYTVTDIIQEANKDLVFTGIDRRIGMHFHDNSDDIFTSSVVIGRLSSNGEKKEFIHQTGLNQSLWGGSDRGNLDIILMPGKLLFSDYGNPKLLKSPQGNGYILMHRGAFDKISFPVGGFRLSTSETYTDAPLFIHIDETSLKPTSFDIVNTCIIAQLPEKNRIKMSGYPRNNKADNTFQSQLITFNKDTRVFDLYESSYRPLGDVYKWSFEPIFNLKWQPATSAKETTNGNQIDVLVQKEKEYDEKFEAQVQDVYDADNNNSNSNQLTSSGSNDDASSSTGAEKVKVRVKTNDISESNGFVYIYWHEDGKEKKVTLSNRTTGSIGYVTAGTELFYRTSDNKSQSARTYFYTVESGRNERSTEIK